MIRKSGYRYSEKIMRHKRVIGVIMSETADIQTKSKPARDSSKDKRTLDQVEKWMEMIREISREPVKN
jgi:hypothetical protein